MAVIGFHGQTVLHRAPQPGRPGDTRQLGDGALMARLTGVDVVHDFRTADVRAGGQGAPLAAPYHAALLAGLDAPAAVLNLGGVANLTWQGAGQLVAFDTGPANAPLNDWVERATGQGMDRDGALALAGRVDEARLARLLEHPYLAAALPEIPRPLQLPRRHGGRAEPGGWRCDPRRLHRGRRGPRARTCCRSGPKRLIVCGGGRKNPAIMAALQTRARVEAVTAETVGWRGDAIEAECFAFLAVRARRGLPISYPATTGVPRPMTGGRVCRRTRGSARDP